MIRPLAAVLVVVLCSLPCRAQQSKQSRACFAKAKTQFALQICASQEARRIVARMNAVYRELLSKAAGRPGAIEKIKVAQAAWVAYRKAYIVAMYPAKEKQGEYGSVYPMEADLLYADLTQKHIADLQRLLRQYSR